MFKWELLLALLTHYPCAARGPKLSMYEFRFNTTELLWGWCLIMLQADFCPKLSIAPLDSNTMIHVSLWIKTDFVFAIIAETRFVFPQRRITANTSRSSDRTECTLYISQWTSFWIKLGNAFGSIACQVSRSRQPVPKRIGRFQRVRILTCRSGLQWLRRGNRNHRSWFRMCGFARRDASGFRIRRLYLRIAVIRRSGHDRLLLSLWMFWTSSMTFPIHWSSDQQILPHALLRQSHQGPHEQLLFSLIVACNVRWELLL